MEGVNTRRAEYAEQTRTALLDAAADAFAQDGFTAASIARIASAARATKGAVYHHFSDKHHLFAAVLAQYNEAAQQKVYDAIGKHPTDPWQAALAGLDATLDVCMDPLAARLIYIEGPVGLGWRRWRDSEEHYTRRNIRLLLQALIDAGIYRDDIPVQAMAQLVTGMITHSGIELAEAPARKRKQIRNELQTAIHQLLVGLQEPGSRRPVKNRARAR
ncbi:TetR/AcrR family transcriptional regulator [Mycobacterium intracellulare]|uniref:TetR/AcrR family transcriptional regulator n=1 Tax=Mycobacterium intracellulare TaxID=1767 RepID=UPI000C7B2896|nr:TetR/AcrR family transcriptional regulator [Mycobacterium intracellulare]